MREIWPRIISRLRTIPVQVAQAQQLRQQCVEILGEHVHRHENGIVAAAAETPR